MDPIAVMEQIYQFEDNKELLKYKFKDTKIPMWMFIRTMTIRNTAYRRIGFVQPKHFLPRKEIKKNFKSSRLCETFLKRNLFLTGHKDIVYALCSQYKLYVHEDGKCFEDLYHPFIKIAPERSSFLIQSDCPQKNSKERPDYLHWKNDVVLKMVAECHLRECADQDDIKTIRQLIKFLNENYPIKLEKEDKKFFFEYLSNISKKIKRLIALFEIYLEIVKPKLVVVDLAHYQDDLRAALLIACRKKNIVSAEFQHAWVGRCHEEYNYGRTILEDKDCGKLFPDYFLTMGDFWNKKVRIKSQIYTIGCDKIHVKKNSKGCNDALLFIASWDYEKYENLLDELLKFLTPDTKIYFRYHPEENTAYQKQFAQKYKKYSNFITANDNEIDFYMERSRYVIVDGSTVCYEALQAGKIVFVLENIFSQYYETNKLANVKTFSNSKEFIKLWNERKNMDPQSDNQFFNTNWKINYKNFIENIGIC